MTRPQLTLAQHIQTVLSQEPPRAKSLCVTVLGDALGPHGGSAWLGDLIALLAPLGINERLLRTSVFRLVAQGWLRSERQGRRALYALAEQGLTLTARASERIYVGPPLEWNNDWTLVILPRFGSSGLAERTALRNQVVGEGFGVLAQGVFAHPHANAKVAHDILEKLGIPDLAVVLRAQDNAAPRGLPITSLVAQCWDLESLAQQYRQLYERFAPFESLVRDGLEPASAFAVRALLIHAWRRIVLHDPQLPAAMLPMPWPGQTARSLCTHLYWAVFEASEQYLTEIAAGDRQHFASLVPSVFERFGGAPAALRTRHAVHESL